MFNKHINFVNKEVYGKMKDDMKDILSEETDVEEAMDFEELQEIVSVCLDEIVQLKQENGELRKVLRALVDSQKEIIKLKQENGELRKEVDALVKSQKDMISSFQEAVDTLSFNSSYLYNAVDNLKYEISDPRASGVDLGFPLFYSIEESIKELVEGKKSMARFGDGEFAIMSNEERQAFQHMDEKLADRLKEVIACEEDGILIGIADNYGSLEKYNDGGRQGIRLYMTEGVRKAHWRFLNKDRIYHNAYISRPYALYADNITDAPKHRFENLKRIWEGRKVVFVEGTLTRLGVGNDLFDNAAQIQRIEAPPVNSFDKYDEILAAALKFAEKDTLFLIALGPTAGVLAYDLYRAGYQAIDIGHVDLEYEWFLKGTGGRCEVKNKYNNEFPNGHLVDEYGFDEKYLREIIYLVGDEE